MKKLLTAVAIAISAVALNAASIDWAFSEMAMNSASPYSLDGYTAYLFDAATWEGFSSVTADTFKDSAKDSQGLTYTSLGGGNVHQWTTGTQTWTDTNAASGNYYIVLFNGTDYAASSSIAATAYASAQEAHTSAAWSIAANQTALAASNFTAASVPEPTSGLLIILGMAGLALKRKHA